MSDTPTPAGIRRAAPWLGLIGLVALWFAARAMAARLLPPGSMVALAGGIVAWVLVAWMDPPAADVLGRLDAPAPRPRWAALALSLVAAGVSWWQAPTDEFRAVSVAAWASASALWYFAWWPKPGGAADRPRAMRPGRWLVYGTLTLLLGVEAWFLFHDFSHVPANPISDHAEEMLDLQDLLGGRHGVFFWRNLGNAPLHFYWVAFLVKVVGLPLHYGTLKLATALFGLLLVPSLFLLGRELGGDGLGLAAAAFGAWSPWSAGLARQGLEYIYPTPLTAVVLWALVRYARRGDRGSVLAAGTAIGVGLHTYLSFRIVPLLVPLALGVLLFDARRRGRRWGLVGDGGLMAATSAILFLPVLKFALLSPNREYFWSRIATRATDAERALPGEPLRIFLDNLWNMAKAFHWKGSSTWTVLNPGEPFLDAVSGALLLAGLVLAVRLAAGGAWRWIGLLASLFVLTLPSTLALAYPLENPSLNRAGTAIPVIFLLVGLAYSHVWRGLRREGPALRTAGVAVLVGGAAWSAAANVQTYFGRFAPAYDALIEHSVEIAAAIRDYRAQGVPLNQCYLLAVDYWVDARNIALELDDPEWVRANNIPPPKVPQLGVRPLVFVYRSNNLARVEELRRLYPNGRARLMPQSHPDRDFGVYYVP